MCERGGQSIRLGLLIPSLSPRYDEGSGGSGDEGRDEAHKQEWSRFYQKQMSLHKVKGHRVQQGLSEPHGSRWSPCSLLSPFPSAGRNCPAAGQDTSWALHAVVFQGKDPEIEEFIPPGWYRNVSRDLWAMLRVWMVGAQLGTWETPES